MVCSPIQPIAWASLLQVSRNRREEYKPRVRDQLVRYIVSFLTDLARTALLDLRHMPFRRQRGLIAMEWYSTNRRVFFLLGTYQGYTNVFDLHASPSCLLYAKMRILVPYAHKACAHRPACRRHCTGENKDEHETQPA